MMYIQFAVEFMQNFRLHNYTSWSNYKDAWKTIYCLPFLNDQKTTMDQTSSARLKLLKLRVYCCLAVMSAYRMFLQLCFVNVKVCYERYESKQAEYRDLLG